MPPMKRKNIRNCFFAFAVQSHLKHKILVVSSAYQERLLIILYGTRFFVGYKTACVRPEIRRDQDERGELDSHEEASPEEIKSREVVLG